MVSTKNAHSYDATLELAPIHAFNVALCSRALCVLSILVVYRKTAISWSSIAKMPKKKNVMPSPLLGSRADAMRRIFDSDVDIQ